MPHDAKGTKIIAGSRVKMEFEVKSVSNSEDDKDNNVTLEAVPPTIENAATVHSGSRPQVSCNSRLTVLLRLLVITLFCSSAFAQSNEGWTTVPAELLKQEKMLAQNRLELTAAMSDFKQSVNAMNDRGENLRGLAAVTYQKGCASCAKQGMQTQGDCASGQCSMQKSKPDG